MRLDADEVRPRPTFRREQSEQADVRAQIEHEVGNERDYIELINAFDQYFVRNPQVRDVRTRNFDVCSTAILAVPKLKAMPANPALHRRQWPPRVHLSIVNGAAFQTRNEPP